MPPRRKTFYVLRVLRSGYHKVVYHRDKSCYYFNRSAGNVMEFKEFDPGVGQTLRHKFEDRRNNVKMDQIRVMHPCRACGS